MLMKNFNDTIRNRLNQLCHQQRAPGFGKDVNKTGKKNTHSEDRDSTPAKFGK